MSPPILRLVRGTRKCESWISAFTEYTKGAQSNDLFRRWSAIGIIAGALERKVWIISQGSHIFPNLYIFLVGPPGVGKTRQLNLAGDLYNSITGTTTENHWVARVSLTKASLMDQLHAALRTGVAGMESFNSLLILSYELGALIPNYDPDFLNALTYVYDCIKYDEQRRGTKNDPLIIERPQITMIGCTTPSYLVNTMPPGAWDQGFLARVIIIYNSETEVLPLKLNEEHPYDNEVLRNALVEDLKDIASRSGKLQFTEDAGALIAKWNNGNAEGSREATAPSHPRLQHYNTRRPIHLLKLCIIAAADTGNDRIDQPEVETALNWLLEAESKMSEVFMAMASGGIASVIHDCWHYAKLNSAATNNMIPTSKIYTFLQGRLPPHELKTAIEIMVKSNMLEHIMIGGAVPGFKVGTAMASL
jgi:hypothetical protein